MTSEKLEACLIFRVNLPRWGLKLLEDLLSSSNTLSVNLPRWGLKLVLLIVFYFFVQRVNLPRWGLKHKIATFSVGCL